LVVVVLHEPVHDEVLELLVAHVPPPRLRRGTRVFIGSRNLGLVDALRRALVLLDEILEVLGAVLVDVIGLVTKDLRKTRGEGGVNTILGIVRPVFWGSPVLGIGNSRVEAGSPRTALAGFGGIDRVGSLTSRVKALRS
jgi:hypothetical protein